MAERMVSMNLIADFLEGKVDILHFIKVLESDEELQAAISSLIPQKLKLNSKLPFWRTYSYDAYKVDDFDCYKHLKRICKFDNSLGDNLNFFSIIKEAYSIEHSVNSTSFYEDIYINYLEIAGETYEGPEVFHLIEDIVYSTKDIKPKTARVKTGKSMIKELFHVANNKIPHWIQGAEWPMGTKTPMQYFGSRKIKDDLDEGREYIFRDFETGKERSIIQYY